MTDRLSRYGRRAIQVVAFATVFGLGACDKHPRSIAQPLDLSSLPKHYDTLSASSLTLNYTPWYIHEWGLEGPDGSGVAGSGPNVSPATADDKPSGGGGGMCCSDIPSVWQPDLTLTVRWLVDKKQDGKTRGYWYKADNVRIPKYGKIMGGLWAVFLPGDRVRIMVADGQKGDANDPGIRPPDNDPYIAHGVLDQEWNQLYRDGGSTQ
ncbi:MULTISPECIES: DUF3304 domain-containing protein [Burkholderia cepacia complex]|uniref:DUF3304 domain-containing protein n=1 Tax=Burkholderia cepacia complex TaxID=87882 RepID=UPI0007549C07|nr:MULTISPECIES: DUF3304 domain-containing protein [Burkholderia cepacia complex]KVN76865.1 hypothetical protein WT15_19870 [Burkholderia stagnalis]KVR09932.1 hypothetical protein WK09_00545 [Burkholderia ubonensis]KVR66197.1 hypothetical protein WK20_07605 [Burkholderia ubonensis]KVT64106.1 hypothetical protein WK54_34425 [Burkholderia ubonensis]KVU67322.1 hypothetical protein WK73_26220 [Burkholderia ubonensis]